MFQLLKKIDPNDKQQIQIVDLLFAEADLSFPDAVLIDIRVRPNGDVECRSDSEGVLKAIGARYCVLHVFNAARRSIPSV